jgi:hypothetical protein
VRFQVTRALDAIEARLRTDPLLTGAVTDLTEAIRAPGPDGRPANLLRVGLLVDALSRTLADESVAVYAVADRSLLSDTDLTSNERMALRRWSDDGFIEIVPQGADALGRVCEVGRLLGQPVITVRALPGYPGARLTPIPGPSGLSLAASGQPIPPQFGGVCGRLWHCPIPECPSFPSGASQPPPRVTPQGVPICPRHQERLIDAGPRSNAVTLALRVNGLARHRFVATAAAPLTVGRAPDGPNSVVLGLFLDERIAPRISRGHLRVEVGHDGAVFVTDISRNGSLLYARADSRQKPRVDTMARDRRYPLGEWDTVELADGVEIGRADRSPGATTASPQPSSVMRDAPTISLRLPPMR